MRDERTEDEGGTQLRGYALRLLSRREYSQAELRTKMKEWLRRRDLRPEEEPLDDILARLVQDGWQDDERFTASYARLRIDRGWGPIKIAYHLRQRGIGEDEITKHCARSQEFWTAQLRKLVVHKYGGTPTDIRNRNARYRFLLGRGFLAEHIRPVLDSQSMRD